MVHTDGLAASILSTINKCLGVLIGKINIIMNLAEHPQMYGLQNSMCACTLYESEVITSLLSNSVSWIQNVTKGVSRHKLTKKRQFGLKTKTT